MTTKKKLLKTIRESAEADLPTHPSDASNETPDTLASKGARAVKPEVDAVKAALASKPGSTKTVASEETEDEMKAESADDDLPTSASDAKATIPEEADEDELHEEEDEDHIAEEEEDEKKAVAEEEEDELHEEEDEDHVTEEDEDEMKLSEEEEEKLSEEEEEDVKEAADALTKDENLPESFKAKVASIFEAAVKRTAKRRAEAHRAKLAEAYSKKLAAKKKTISETLVNKVDGYLDYVVEEWMKENEVAIETAVRSDITEKFIVGLKNLFESHYIEVPAEKADVITQQEKKIVALERELNEELVKSVELRKENINLKRANIIKKHTEGLTVSDAAKFTDLCEGVSFETAKAFSQKLQVIKETYFPKSPRNSGDLDASLLTEGGLDHIESRPVQTEVDIYAQTISRMVKR
jgi:hypothetical protein